MYTRRQFLTGSAVAANALIVPSVRADEPATQPWDTKIIDATPDPTTEIVNHLQLDILRPTGFSAHLLDWKSGI